MKPYSLKAGEGRTFDYGIPHVLKTGELNPGRGAAIFELNTKAGEEPPDHTHGTEDECFYVVEGKICFHCDGQTFDLEQGGFMFLPMGMKHGYKIKGEGPVRLLVITNPVRESEQGWGGYIADVESQGELLGDAPAS